MVYELYFPEEIKAGDAEVLKHLGNLPELKEGQDEQNLKTIEKVYKELSDPKHPISAALLKLLTIEEVNIIEGRKWSKQQMQSYGKPTLNPNHCQQRLQSQSNRILFEVINNVNV